MTTIEVQFDAQQVTDHVRNLMARLDDVRPLMQDLGEYLIESTKRRFAAGVAPTGVAWAPNSPLTLSRKKGTRPLIGETKRLGTEIVSFFLLDRETVEVGSNLVYAATQQFGAAQGAFGRSKRNGPIPWGNIPARPFIGLSSDDERNVVEIVQEYLAGALDDATV